jgi:hypothetical protein
VSASIESPPIEAAALNQAEAVEALLSRLEGLARQPLAAREFFQQAVEGLLSALSAISVLGGCLGAERRRTPMPASGRHADPRPGATRPRD